MNLPRTVLRLLRVYALFDGPTTRPTNPPPALREAFKAAWSAKDANALWDLDYMRGGFEPGPWTLTPAGRQALRDHADAE